MSASSAPARGVAVIGMSCRLPGADGPDEFWTLLTRGGDAVRPAPAHRASGLDGPAVRGGWLDRPDLFDADFFGLRPAEAAMTDPQHRLGLELAWEAIEDAGVRPGALRGTPVGVFAAVTATGYADLLRNEGIRSFHTLPGTARAMLANRVSHHLGLRGPSLTVDTGQSSSLVAVHLACESLRRAECDAALVTGVHLNLDPASAHPLADLGVLSPAGRCAVFDAGADGTVRAEGGVTLLLKPLPAAVRDADPVYAVLLGSATNHDGDAGSLIAPHPEAQRDVQLAACRAAGITAAEVDYVELHGTGTPAGDAAEARGLGGGLAARRPAGRPLLAGSVKSNIGHLEAAAGIAGLAKLVLAVSHARIPASLHFTTAGPPLDGLGLRVPATAVDWPRTGRPRCGGVSSFGLGGANCHVIVTQAPGPAAPAPLPQETPIWVLSGRSERDLRAQAARLAPATAALHPADVARTLDTGRTRFAYRAAVLGGPAALAALAEGTAHAGVIRGLARPGPPVFVLPGQGGQWPGMARALLEESRPFAAAVAECETAFAGHLDWSLTDVLRGAPGTPASGRDDVTQAALFATTYALAAMWADAGVRPAALIGHSQGEVTAACLAGALSLADAARVVAARGRAVQSLAGTGAMLAVALDAAELAPLLTGDLHLAAENGPGSAVVSGAPGAVAALARECAGRGVRTRLVDVPQTSPSPHADRLRQPLLTALTGVARRPGRVRVHSTVDTAHGFATPEYWCDNLRRPVRFADAVRAALTDGHRTFVEVSPHPVLTTAVADIAGAAGLPAAALGTLRRDDGGADRFLRALAEAHVNGVDVDLGRILPPGRRTRLPTYPFDRRSHWRVRAGSPGTAATPRQAAPEPESDPLGIILDQVAAQVGGAPADPGRTFGELGLGSVGLAEFCAQLRLTLGVPLSPATVFSHPTPQALAAHLTAVRAAPLRTAFPEPGGAAPPLTALPDPAGAAPPRDPAGAALGRALTDLERLLPGLDDAAAARASDRLRDLLSLVRRADPGPALDTATDDELFAVLDGELGPARAGEPDPADPVAKGHLR